MPTLDLNSEQQRGIRRRAAFRLSTRSLSHKIFSLILPVVGAVCACLPSLAEEKAKEGHVPEMPAWSAPAGPTGSNVRTYAPIADNIPLLYEQGWDRQDIEKHVLGELLQNTDSQNGTVSNNFEKEMPPSRGQQAGRQTGGQVGEPSLPSARQTDERLVEPSLPSARQTDERLVEPSLPSARQTDERLVEPSLPAHDHPATDNSLLENSIPAEAAALEVDTDIDADTNSALNEYRIHPLDSVHIEVFREPDISQAFRVSREGMIDHPLLEKVHVAGLTIAEAEEKIKELLEKDFLVNPRVVVTVKESASQRIFVLGQVNKPGSYEVLPSEQTTLLELILRAGGLTDIAAAGRVKIVRTEEGRKKTIKVNVSDLMRGEGKTGDIELRAGDIIMVPETIF